MCSVVASVIVVDWMSAVEIGAFRDSVCITVPNRSCVVRGVEHAVLTISTCGGRVGVC